MLSFLKQWIISVAVMVIFMALVDLILPANNFRKYAKFVTGLIVIVTILTPVFKLFDKSIDTTAVISNYIESFDKSSSGTDKNKNDSSFSSQTIEVFKENLKSSIEKEILDESGRNYTVSSLEIVEDTQRKDFGDIKSISLKKSSDDNIIKPVEKVVIGSSTKTESSGVQKDSKVLEILKSKYGIDPSSVKFVK